MKYCEKCGNQLLDEAIMCPKCGCAVAGKQPTKEQNAHAKKQDKNMMVATLMFLGAIAIVVFTIIAVTAQLN